MSINVKGEFFVDDAQFLSPFAVLSMVFRKFISMKSEICAEHPGKGAAKPRLFADERLC